MAEMDEARRAAYNAVRGGRAGKNYKACDFGNTHEEGVFLAGVEQGRTEVEQEIEKQKAMAREEFDAFREAALEIEAREHLKEQSE